MYVSGFHFNATLKADGCAMVEIVWVSVVEGRVQAQAGEYVAVIAKRMDGWGWTVLHGGANAAHWDGGQCESLDEAKDAAGKILMQKIHDEEAETARLQMVEKRNAGVVEFITRKKV